MKYQGAEPTRVIVDTQDHGQDRPAGAFANARDEAEHEVSGAASTATAVPSVTTAKSQLNSILIQSSSQFDRMMDKIVDDTFDTILFVSQNDKVKARSIFNQN